MENFEIKHLCSYPSSNFQVLDKVLVQFSNVMDSLCWFFELARARKHSFMGLLVDFQRR
ncbi:hypothetical protein Scep_000176 [Stephania cephalantha]|uniref:Uncharacterized protein n=1 Tax=Stephania cephalantha TaxID=152367 RepID=A0AAP0L8C0_9MAGN